MFEILQYPFMQRALVAGIFLALILAVLGVFVLLRRMAFFADGIAHSSLLGVALALIFSWNPLLMAIIISLFFASLIFLLEKKYGLSADSAIGIIFTSGMALGILLISTQSGYQPELMSFLFGNILAISNSDLMWILIFGMIILVYIFWKFKDLVLLSLDRDIAHVQGIKVDKLQLITCLLLTVAVVLGVKILGIILVSALLIIPTAGAKIAARSFKRFFVQSVIISETTVIVGIFLSFYLDLPAGPTIVLSGTGIFLFFLLLTRFRSS